MRVESDKLGPIRKLNDVLLELKPLAEQEIVAGFFNNVENADTLGGLVENIRDAVMEYQVRNHYILSLPLR